MIDSTAQLLLHHLHRGGQYGYWWSTEGRQSFWWEVGRPEPLPGGRRNTYFGVHPTRAIPTTNVRGEAAEPRDVRSQIAFIAAINCLFAEYDAKDYGGDKALALAAIDALDDAPSVVIDSGGGYHAYWLLAEPFVLERDEDRDYARLLQAAWVRFVGSDPASKDLARVLRVPGTHNHKYSPTRPVAFVRADLNRHYTLAALADRCAMFVESNRPLAEPTRPDRSEAERAEGYLDRLAHWRAEGYNDWLAVGCALRPLGLRGLALWDEWSRQSDKYEPGTCERKWPTLPADAHGVAKLGAWANQDTPLSLAVRSRHGMSPSRDRTRIELGSNSASERHERIELGSNWQDSVRRSGRLITSGELLSLPPARWLVEGILPADDLVTWYGMSGVGKSFALLDLSATIAQQHTVIYVAAEALQTYTTRLAAWQSRHKRETGQLLWWTDALNLLDSAAVQAFITIISPLRPAMIVFDTLARCLVGGDENSARDMGLAVDAAETIRRITGATIVFSHHTDKRGTAERGSSALRGACATMIEQTNDDGLIAIKSDKSRNGLPFTPRYFRLTQAGVDAVLTPTSKVAMQYLAVSERQMQVLETLRRSFYNGSASFTELANDTEMSKSSLSAALSRLIDRGYIQKEREMNAVKLYLTDAGKDFIARQDHQSEAEQFDPSIELGSFNWSVSSIGEETDRTDRTPHQEAENNDTSSISSIRVRSEFDPPVPVRSIGSATIAEPIEQANEPNKQAIKVDQVCPTVLSDPLAAIPERLRMTTRMMLVSSTPHNQKTARERCEEYGIDYEAARAVVRRRP